MTDVYVEKVNMKTLAKYKELIIEGKIWNQHAIYSRGTGTTVIEYDSDIPHEEIVEFLKK